MTRPDMTLEGAPILRNYYGVGLHAPSIAGEIGKSFREYQNGEVRSSQCRVDYRIHVLVGETVSDADKPVNGSCVGQ